jgi:predicted PurR-regulated permease PerM
MELGLHDLGRYAGVSAGNGATESRPKVRMNAKAPVDALISATDDESVVPPIEPEKQPVMLHMPVDVRSASLALVAVLAGLYTLSWAKAVFIPLLLGLMASYALSPIVDRFERWRIPRVLGSATLLIAIVSALGWTAYYLSDDANTLIESLPDVAQKFRQSMQARSRGPGPKPAAAIDRVQQAATELERAAESNASSPANPRGVTRVIVEKPKFNVKDYFWTGTIGLVALIGQATVVLFLTFFLLASGSTFRRKMVRIAGPTFSEKKLTIQALDEITDQIQRYLLVQVFTSLLVAVATWLCFLWLGVQHAAVWGLVAGVLNFIPYVGSIVFTVGSAAVGLMQFGNIESAVLVGSVSLAIHTVSGYVLTPWLTSRAGRMNAVTVFVGVLAWGWLWGLWGLLLGVPILMVVKSVCDRVDNLKPVGELLGS